MRGLISTWLEIAVNSLLSLPRADDRRIWVILDELPTLHQLPSLRSGLAESRQYGGCFVLGVQVFSALRDLYGRDGATTISGLCGTRVVLAAPDKDTSEWSAQSLGQVEIESLSEGVSYDTGERPGAPRGGVTLSTRRDLRPLVLPSEVSRLQNLSGYIKLPGDLPVARIRLRYKSRDRVAARFVPKAEPGRGGGNPCSTAEETAALAGPDVETGVAGLRAEVEAGGVMSDEAAAQGGAGVLEAAEWVHGGGPLPGGGGDAQDEPPWLLEELAASAGAQDARDGSSSPGQSGGERAGGAGDAGKKRTAQPGAGDGERQVRRPLWL